MPKYSIQVVVEHNYEKTITAKSKKEALAKAIDLNIQDDQNNFVSIDVMEPSVFDENGNLLE